MWVWVVRRVFHRLVVGSFIVLCAGQPVGVGGAPSPLSFVLVHVSRPFVVAAAAAAAVVVVVLRVDPRTC